MDLSRPKVELPQGLQEQLQAERKVTMNLTGLPGGGGRAEGGCSNVASSWSIKTVENDDII